MPIGPISSMATLEVFNRFHGLPSFSEIIESVIEIIKQIFMSFRNGLLHVQMTKQVQKMPESANSAQYLILPPDDSIKPEFEELREPEATAASDQRLLPRIETPRIASPLSLSSVDSEESASSAASDVDAVIRSPREGEVIDEDSAFSGIDINALTYEDECRQAASRAKEEKSRKELQEKREIEQEAHLRYEEEIGMDEMEEEIGMDEMDEDRLQWEVKLERLAQKTLMGVLSLKLRPQEIDAIRRVL